MRQHPRRATAQRLLPRKRLSLSPVPRCRHTSRRIPLHPHWDGSPRPRREELETALDVELGTGLGLTHSLTYSMYSSSPSHPTFTYQSLPRPARALHMSTPVPPSASTTSWHSPTSTSQFPKSLDLTSSAHPLHQGPPPSPSRLSYHSTVVTASAPAVDAYTEPPTHINNLYRLTSPHRPYDTRNIETASTTNNLPCFSVITAQ